MSDTSLVFNILAKDKATAVFNKVKGSAAGAGLAIGAALGAGVAAMLAKSKTDAVLAAQLGAGTPAAAAAGKAAGAVYAAGVVETMEEANAAVKAAVQNALVAPDASSAAIDAVASKVANLAKVMEEDSGRVGMAVSTMLKTGMAKNAEEAFDMIQFGVERGLNKSGDLLDSFNEYPSILQTVGIGGKTAFGLVSQGMAAGARDSDKIVDAIKEFSLRAVDGSKTTAGAFKRLGLDASKTAADIAAGGPRAAAAVDSVLDRLRKMPATAERAQTIQQLFGGPGEDLGAAIFALDVSKAAGSLDGMAGAADRAGQALEQSAGAKLDAFKRRAQGALIDALAAAVPYIEATFGWLSRNKDWVVPVAIGLGALAGAIYTITTAMKIWTAVQAILNLALWTSPITWIVIGVIALVAAIYLIATKTTWFQTIWSVAWGGIKAAAQWVFNWIVGGWNWVITTVVGAAKLWWTVFSGFWTGVGRVAAGVFSWIGGKINSLVGTVRGLPGRLASAGRNLFGWVRSAFRSAINWVISRWNSLSFRVPGVSIPGIGQVWGGMNLSMPNVPMLAKGGTATTSGLAIVGERGPELVSLSRGAQVTPLRGGAGGGAAVIELRSDGSRLADLLVEILRLAIRRRGGNVQIVLGKGGG